MGDAPPLLPPPPLLLWALRRSGPHTVPTGSHGRSSPTSMACTLSISLSRGSFPCFPGWHSPSPASPSVFFSSQISPDEENPSASLLLVAQAFSPTRFLCSSMPPQFVSTPSTIIGTPAPTFS